MAGRPRKKKAKSVVTLVHDEAQRRNIPTAEYQPVLSEEDKASVRLAYERRNRDLDPQLVWRGKDEQDIADLVVQAPPLYIQEKVHPKVLIDDLLRQTKERREDELPSTPDLFADFNGLPNEAARTEFYHHEANWSNRMILGDGLQVMASLAEREGLRGKVQCIYIDPPYGIKFNSNFQWSTTSRDVRDGKAEHITREPEMVKAFRDTWRDGIHSYLSYLRDRLTVARDLLTESGSVFVQIGDENVHRVRALMDEVFCEKNFVGAIVFNKTTGFSGNYLSRITDTILWYGKSDKILKYRPLWRKKNPGDEGATKVKPLGSFGALTVLHHDPTRLATSADLTSQGASDRDEEIDIQGRLYPPKKGLHWKTTTLGLRRLNWAGRLFVEGKSPRYIRFVDDFSIFPYSNVWMDIGGIQSRTDPKVYVVQTANEAIKRCILMTTDPGDLVLDPTCGSGTTAYVAEQWGRRWITIDTSRVALALARARIMGARYPYYLLADSHDGKLKEADLSSKDIAQSESQHTYHDIRQGFVYERVPHITLKAIANNAEIDTIHEQLQPEIEAALAELNAALWGHGAPFVVDNGGRKGSKVQFDAPPDATVSLSSGETVATGKLLEWEVPRQAPTDWPKATVVPLNRFWNARVNRQKAIDQSIARQADYEYLYDKPFTDNKKVRVAGPFTVESLSPHRTLTVDADDELIDPVQQTRECGTQKDFVQMILDNLETAGVQQANKDGRIEFDSLKPWPGKLICAEGSYRHKNDPARRAAVFIGPEFGTVSRADLVSAAREAAESGFDLLIGCAFNYDAHSTEFDKLGCIPVLKARMNADLHMDLKNTGKGNLFVIFGEPDIDIEEVEEGEDGGDKIRVRIKGVDVFHPNTGEIRSDGTDGIAGWFVDTDYNEESFFVRHAYFLGTNDPYKALKTTLKAEVDADAWATLNSDTSRPFPRPKSGRIAVKVINHLGDEVMKVIRV